MEVNLQTIAGFQRMLEGECYVTGSIVALTVFQIQRAHTSVLASEDTHPAVRHLTEILLTDFNN